MKYNYNKFKAGYSTQISVISLLQHNPTLLPCYTIFSTFLFEATALSYPHKIDIYTFIAHSFSTEHVCRKYRSEISFFFIISVKWVIIPLFHIYIIFIWTRSKLRYFIFLTRVYICETCSKTPLSITLYPADLDHLDTDPLENTVKSILALLADDFYRFYDWLLKKNLK